MKQVWKYQLLSAGLHQISAPIGVEFLSVQVQTGKPCIWALVDPDAKIQTIWLRVAGTGEPIAEMITRFIGTFQLYGGTLVLHVFEVQR